MLFCHDCPASTTRYLLTFDGRTEDQISSGIWISTAAGSTSVIRSAGGKEMPPRSRRLQFAVREPFPLGGKDSRVAPTLIHGYVPEEWVARHLASGSWYVVPAAVLLGIPLYSNATGIIPVAEAMLGKGVAIGTTLALMMSVAALSLPEMLILRKVIKWQALGLFACVLAIAFVLVGWFFNVLT